MPPFMLQIVYKAIVALAIMLALYSGYSYIKNIGYKEAEVVYQQKISDYENKLNKKIDTIETLASTLVAENRESAAILTTDVAEILAKTKGKTLTIVKNGECIPSKTFSDSFVEINKRTNQSMKGSDK